MKRGLDERKDERTRRRGRRGEEEKKGERARLKGRRGRQQGRAAHEAKREARQKESEEEK